MNRFWSNIIQPIIKSIKADYIIEIGSDTGINTQNIMEYCVEYDAHMTSIDPLPKFDINEFKAKYGDKFQIYPELSLSRLPLLEDYDVILLDGDHNWYTVYNELKIVEKSFKNKKFPIVFLHDIGWPYARRDLYYNPENVPGTYRQPYKKLGIYPGQTNLKEQGGLNSHLNNAIYENNPKNGVLTAVEDFICESDLEFSFMFINAFHGLGILFIKNDEMENTVKKVIKNANLLDDLEEERINLTIVYSEESIKNNSLKKELTENKVKLEYVEDLFNQTADKLQQAENKLKSSEELIEEKGKQIEKKEIYLNQMADKLSQIENELKSSTNVIQKKERQLGNIKIQLNQIVDRLDLKEIKLKSSNELVKEKEIQLRQLKSRLGQTKNQLEASYQLVNEKESELGQTDGKLKSSTQLIKEKEKQLEGKDIQLKQLKRKLKQAESRLDLSNKLILEKQNFIASAEKREKKVVKDLNAQIDSLKVSLIEMEYVNDRSITQRLISKFPSLYILFNINETGIKNALINIKGYKSIKKNKLVDIGFYLRNNKSIRLSGMDPIIHYMYHGFKENKKPNSSFDGDYYLKRYKDVKESNLNPLVHYTLYGKKEGRKTFKTSKNQNKNIISNKKLQLEADYELIINSGLFDVNWYMEQYKKVDYTQIDPVYHYLKIGTKEGHNPNRLFDTNWYLKNNRDVENAKINPLIHFIKYGAAERRDPHPLFSVSKYINENSDVAASNINPLLHYIKYGIIEGRKSYSVNREFQQYSNNQITTILGVLNKKVSIIIPIYNAFEDTKKCINSVLKNTRIPYEIILIDDCSPDKRINVLLDEMEDFPNVKIIRNQENKGFVKNVNIGIQNSEGDVVLLNSDTVVTPKWLQKLVLAAYSDNKIGTVTPFSNAAGAFSVPEIGKENEIPKDLKLDGMANLVEKVSTNFNLRVPTGNGFCMFIKRSTINDVGLFDEENFGRGYCEENDFCMRAEYKGWSHIIDDSTYIYHKKSVSFKNERNSLMQKHRDILDKKHPTYTKKTREFVSSKKYEDIRDNIKNALNSPNKRRILYVLHQGGGGTPQTNEDLMNHVQSDLDCYVLTSSAKEVILWRYVHSKFKKLNSWILNSKWSAKDFYNPEFRDIYFNVLTGLKIDIVHIRHLIKHSFDLPNVAESLGLPIIMSFHDFYFVCPSYNLLDENNNYCAGKCTEWHGQCNIPMKILGDLPHLKTFIGKWRAEVSNIFSKVSAFVTTSEIVKQVFISVYPQLLQKEFRVIEHGRDFKIIPDSSKLYEIPSEDKLIKILVPGNINNHKGAEFIKQLKKEDKDSRLEFHFIGALQNDLNLEDYGIYHGSYKRNDFCKLVKKIKPSFIGILSIWPETYCHTLSEAWACGIPVLATKIGVLEERVNKNGGGWLLNHKNHSNAYNEIIKIANSPEEYVKVAEQVKEITFKSTKEMAAEYMNLYSQNLIYPLLNEDIQNKDLSLNDFNKECFDHSNYKDLKRSLKGKDGYLFLINDFNNEIRQHFDESYVSNFKPDVFFRNFNLKKEYCSDRNIQYFFFIIPDKSLVCKKLLPFDVDMIKRNYDLVNDLAPDFTKNLDNACYFKNDTHINYFGGKELAYRYLNHINGNFKRDDFNKLIKEQITSANVARLCDLTMPDNWSYSKEEKEKYPNNEIVSFKNKFLTDLKENLPEKFKSVGTRETEHYKNTKGMTNLKVLILRDSSVNYLKDVLSVYFKEILLYWDHWFFNKELVEWYKPDIILEIRTERFLEKMEERLGKISVNEIQLFKQGSMEFIDDPLKSNTKERAK